MTPLPWLILAFVLSPAGFFYVDARGVDTISLVLACCAVSAALVGAVLARLAARHRPHAVVAVFLAAFLLATNVYFFI